MRETHAQAERQPSQRLPAAPLLEAQPPAAAPDYQVIDQVHADHFAGPGHPPCEQEILPRRLDGSPVEVPGGNPLT